MLNNDGLTDNYALSGRRDLERTMQITNIFRSVIGADPGFNRIRPVFDWQQGNDVWYEQNEFFPWFESTYGPLANFFYASGNANYGYAGDTSSVNAIINGLVAGEATTYARPPRSWPWRPTTT